MNKISNALVCLALTCLLIQPDKSRAEVKVEIKVEVEATAAANADADAEAEALAKAEAEALAEAKKCQGFNVLTIEEQPLTVELASDKRTRRYGLRNREIMGENCGMLFVYENNLPRIFTMRDTLIPLDIAFINKEGIIAELRTMELGTERVPSNVAATYVLEVNAGWFETNNLSVGSEITFQTDEESQPLSSLSLD